ncbi:putative ribonuclease inhibitor-like protein [Monocercomonoides exilis]|uniref:putative ribonuclease inhibitor-like protein n=1 Tax=Monocercomonoides exilis TaxID=2049356 RepID=UPI00355A6CA6|nr:putative ribonuclease inhibitor-like protein [Monocercomonoides exilis]|eukprot:MONOS_1192.1-p1 / transcript=MONOS_1192.1 / gene=MONOS_1192 / organism=Monocercomonoides_exilis_PA203 / gene_product=ribonuclease inhibitor-like protein / transcript_product=ribonuclease inhibitor-like protein / location=Mono_scaffold00020:114659-118463(-) / protein_length=1247 / sequence_SO=supercontig / SO=protein_coding / is_pseudo=false
MEQTYMSMKSTNEQDDQYPLLEEEETALFEAKCEDLKRAITDVQKERFIRTLRTHCCNRIFDLGECGIGPVAMMIVEEILLRYPQYSVLKLSSNMLKDQGVLYLASLFRRGGSSIVSLDLRSNDIGPLGAGELFLSLMGNCTLCHIDLSSVAGANRNHIGSAATTFAEFLVQNQVLTSINLESNSIALEGLTSIVHALACYNTTLTELELSSNSFGADGATLIGALLPNTQLKILGFSRNDIGDRGVIEIARGLFEPPEEVLMAIEKKRQEAKEKRKKERERLGLPERDDDDSDDWDEDIHEEEDEDDAIDEGTEEKKPKDEREMRRRKLRAKQAAQRGRARGSGRRGGGRMNGGATGRGGGAAGANMETTVGVMNALAMPDARTSVPQYMGDGGAMNSSAMISSMMMMGTAPASRGRMAPQSTARQRIAAAKADIIRAQKLREKQSPRKKDARSPERPAAFLGASSQSEQIAPGQEISGQISPSAAAASASPTQSPSQSPSQAQSRRESAVLEGNGNGNGNGGFPAVASMEGEGFRGYENERERSASGQEMDWEERRRREQEMEEEVRETEEEMMQLDVLGTLADPAAMDHSKASEEKEMKDLEELFNSLVPPLPADRKKQKKPRLKRKIQGVFALNPRGERVCDVIAEATEPVAEDDDEEDTEDEDLEAKGTCRLEQITLSSNNITEKGAKVLAVSLMKNRFLTHLDVSHNKLGTLGGQAVAEMIATNEVMVSLVLTDCKIGSVGGMHIGRALSKNRCLQKLDLSSNAILDEGALAVSEGIAQNGECQLVELDLSTNGITDRGGSALANALSKNTSVRKIALLSNEFENETVSAFISCLRTNSVLTCIDLRFNNSAHILVMAMEKLIAENVKLRKEGHPARLASQLQALRADVEREMDMLQKKRDSEDTLRAKCEELIRIRQELEDVKKKCADDENALLNEIDSNAKLMISLSEETQTTAAAASKERADGDFRSRQLMTKAGRVGQQRNEAEKRRIRWFRELENEGIDEEEEEGEEKEEKEEKKDGGNAGEGEKGQTTGASDGKEGEGEAKEAKEGEGEKAEKESGNEGEESASSSTSPSSATPDGTITIPEGEEGAKTDNEKTESGEEKKEEGEAKGEDGEDEKQPHLTIAHIHRLREQYEEEMVHSRAMLVSIKEWTTAQQLAFKTAKATKKWEPGPPLPFDFLPEEEKKAIQAANAEAERKKKADELKMLLGGSATPDANPKSKAKAKRASSKAKAKASSGK